MITQGQYTLVNANEEIVETQALELMQKYGMCCCEKCLIDVCALALNQLSGHYVTSRKGEIIGKALRNESDSKTELVVEVVKAIERVRVDPQHS